MPARLRRLRAHRRRPSRRSRARVLPAAADTIPLVIQDKTFLDTTTTATDPAVYATSTNVAKTRITDPTWPFAINASHNDLWYPHVYMPNQNPNDLAGVNAMGRWDYGPWFWPPWTVTQPAHHQRRRLGHAEPARPVHDDGGVP